MRMGRVDGRRGYDGDGRTISSSSQFSGSDGRTEGGGGGGDGGGGGSGSGDDGGDGGGGDGGGSDGHCGGGRSIISSSQFSGSGEFGGVIPYGGVVFSINYFMTNGQMRSGVGREGGGSVGAAFPSSISIKFAMCVCNMLSTSSIITASHFWK